MTPPEIRLEDLVGREVLAGDGRRVGRIEEFRAEWAGGRCTLAAYVIGVAGLYERLGLGLRMLAGHKRRGRIARWDQIDLSDPARPRLTCRPDDLEPA